MSDGLPALDASPSHEASARADNARAIRSAFKLGYSLLLTGGVVIAVRLVIPRSLGPAGFGVYNFADAFSTTCFIILTLGVDQYIHKEIPLRLAHATDFFAGVVALRFVAAILVSLVMWVILVVSHRTVEVQAVVLLFAGYQFFTLSNDSLASFLHAANRIDGLTVANVATKVVWAGLLIVLALTHSGLLALAGATVGVEILRSGWLWILARQNLDLRWRMDLAGAVAVLIASMPFFVNTIAHTAYSKVDATMLAFLASDAEVGYYGVGQIFGVFTLIFTPLIGWVLLPLSARAAARSRDELIALLGNSLRVILSLAIPLALGLWLGAADLLHLAYGAKYLPSTFTLEVLAPLFVVTYVAMVAATTLIRLDRAWNVTVISLGGLVLTPLFSLALVRPMSHAFGPGGAAGGAAVALLITELSVTTAMLVTLRGEILTSSVLRSVGASLGCAAVVVVMDHFLAPGLGVWRYLLDGLAYAGLAVVSGGVHPGELLRVVADGLRSRSHA